MSLHRAVALSALEIATTYHNFYFSAVLSWVSPHHPLSSWWHCSLTPSPAALLLLFTVSHQLSPHVHPALKTQLIAPHSLSMHKQLNCILLLTPLWHSCQVTILLIQTSQLPTLPGSPCAKYVTQATDQKLFSMHQLV